MIKFNKLKGKFHNAVTQFKESCDLSACIQRFVRLQKLVTVIKSPEYKRSNEKIEIDITYECNLSCANCNRSSLQAPSKERMTMAQIEKFINESIDKDIRWKSICLLGGEPTLHPDILGILSILLDYKDRYSPDVILKVKTNGTGDFVKNILRNIPGRVEIEDTNKGPMGYRHQHTSFNVAPIDSIWYKLLDFSNGCSVLKNCGMGLTPYGYYCCVVAGGIDRVFGFDMGRKTLPGKNDLMIEQLNKFCRLCGHFKINKKDRGIRLSPTWEKAYKEYALKKPKLSFY